MMARNATVPLTGRIQKRKTNHLLIVIFALQRAAGLYRWARSKRENARASTKTAELITLCSKLVGRGYKLLEAGACSSFGRLECIAQ